LPGVIQSVSVTHDQKAGFISVDTQNMGTSFAGPGAAALKGAGFENSIREGKNLLIPKLMTISFSLDVVHDHQLGWDYHSGEWRGGAAGPRFPYDFGLVRDTTDTPSAGETAPSSSPAANIPGTPDNRATDQALCEGFDDKTDKAGIAGADTLNTGGCSG
jgi:hypothetical protein